MAYYSYFHQMNLWFRMYCMRYPSILPSFYQTYYDQHQAFAYTFIPQTERRSVDHIEYLKRFFYQRSLHWKSVTDCSYFYLLHPIDQQQLQEWEAQEFPCLLTAQHVCDYFSRLCDDDHYTYQLFYGVKPYLNPNLIHDILQHPQCGPTLSSAIYYHYPEYRRNIPLSMDHLYELSFNYPDGFALIKHYLQNHTTALTSTTIPNGFHLIASPLDDLIGFKNVTLASNDDEMIFIVEPIGTWLLHKIYAIEDAHTHWTKLSLLLPYMIVNYGQYDYSEYMAPHVESIWKKIGERHKDIPLMSIMDWFVAQQQQARYDYLFQEIIEQIEWHPNGRLFSTLLQNGASLSDILRSYHQNTEGELYW